METLAVNKSASMTKFDKLIDLFCGLMIVGSTGLTANLTVKIFFFEGGDLVAGLFSLAATLFCGYMTLFFFDNYMRCNYAVETISVQDGDLVIECTKSLLRKFKRIPLSSIHSVEMYDGTYSFKISFPDKLRVRYGDGRRYRFGIDMTDKKRKALAKKIMDIAGKQCS